MALGIQEIVDQIVPCWRDWVHHLWVPKCTMAGLLLACKCLHMVYSTPSAAHISLWLMVLGFHTCNNSINQVTWVAENIREVNWLGDYILL